MLLCQLQFSYQRVIYILTSESKRNFVIGHWTEISVVGSPKNKSGLHFQRRVQEPHTNLYLRKVCVLIKQGSRGLNFLLQKHAISAVWEAKTIRKSTWKKTILFMAIFAGRSNRSVASSSGFSKSVLCRIQLTARKLILRESGKCSL